MNQNGGVMGMLSTTTTERKPGLDTNDHTQRLTQKVRLVGSTAYQYHNLKDKEFRLLLLGPGRKSSRLSASLEHASLDDAIRPQYETISYTWGDATARAKINIDGKKLDIPASAAEVLCQVRTSHEARRIWIDAICIDQSNTRERGHQVALMQQIYSRGMRNLIYLGPSDVHTAAGLQVVKSLIAELDEQSGGASDFRELLYPEGIPHRYSPGEQQMSLHEQQILHSLYSRPWFSRLWILQEAALSPFNICLYGEHTVSLFNLLAAACYAYQKRRMKTEFHEAFYNAVCVFDVVYQGFSEYTRHVGMKRDLVALLQISCRAKASIPHDHVFSLLGLLRLSSDAEERRSKDGVDVLGVLMGPDYTKTAAEVFSDASRGALILDRTLTLFHGIDHRNEASVIGRDFPSWVLDLRMNEHFDQRSANMFGVDYIAGYWSPDQNLSRVPSSTLILKGRLLDSVLEAGPVGPRTSAAYYETSLFLHASADVACCAPLVQAAEDALDDEHTRALQVFARTLVAGVYGSARQRANMNALPQFFAFLKLIEFEGRYNDGFATLYMQSTAVFTYRRIFRTLGGSVGLGPRCMQEQDKLVIFYQAGMPCIVRPSEYEGFYHFVGCCYVDGIMDGEAFAGSRAMPDPYRDQEFHLW